jgi:hypothetical protein
MASTVLGSPAFGWEARNMSIEWLVGIEQDNVSEVWLEEHDVLADARFLRVEARSLILHAYMPQLIDEHGTGKVPIRCASTPTPSTLRSCQRSGRDHGRQLLADAASC